MKVVILCGGLGTRLREETEFRPKPMVPVGGRPMHSHIMNLLRPFRAPRPHPRLGYVRNDTFLMTYGDGVTDSDLKAAIRCRERHSGKVSSRGNLLPGPFPLLCVVEI